MPTINTETIEGFAEMTAEQKVEALLKLDVPERVDLTGYVKKDLFDRTSSELAEAKKTIKAKMTDDEKAAAEREAKWAEMEEKLKQLEQEKQESIYKANYLALGYEDKLAEDTAKAMVAGDMAKVFENQRKANEAAEKRFKSQRMDDIHKPRGGGGEEKKEDKNIELARELGKRKSEAANASNDILKHYMK